MKFTKSLVAAAVALSALGATLTLPGIAGMVLTMGIAVDSNVLVYERIREEQRAAKTHPYRAWNPGKSAWKPKPASAPGRMK